MLFQKLAAIIFVLATLSEAAVPAKGARSGLWKRDHDSNSKQTATCLSPKALQIGSKNNGQETPVAGQSPSQT